MPLLKIMKGVDLMVIRLTPMWFGGHQVLHLLPAIRSLEKYRFSSHLIDKQKTNNTLNRALTIGAGGQWL